MERLKWRDLRTLLGILREIYALRDLDAFAAYIISALPKLIPSEYTSYNEVNPPRRRIAWRFWPPGSLDFPDSVRIFEQHLFDNPLIARYHRTRDDQALKISDFVPQSQFHRTGLYNEFYRRLGVEYQMACTLPMPSPLILGIALNRRRRDFSERDRLLLNLLRPHLTQAYRNAVAVTQKQQGLTLATQVVEGLELGVVVLTREGRVRLMNSRGRHWVAEYFGAPARPPDRLPECLRRWVQRQEAALAHDDVPPARQPLVVEREGKRLVVRLLSDPAQNLLVLQERCTAIPPAAFECFGLSRREAEVLAWVAQGKTNVEIGMILGISPRTAEKHVERIYQKLGVETRTAAATLALTSGSAPY